MSIGKKRREREAEAEANGDAADAQPPKKLKVDAPSPEGDAPVANGGERDSDKERRRKEKKEKKEKKAKREKEEKEGEEEKEGKKGKKEKKEKKKDKKRKKEAETEEGAPADPESSEKAEKKKKKKKHREHKSEEAVANEAEATNGTDNETSSPAEDEEERSASSTPAKQLYRQTDALSAVPSAEIQEFLSKEQITLSDPTSPKGSNELRPILRFEHLPTSALLSKSPFASFSKPTPIQSASWPFSLSGRDVIGVAETGSGKTLAFSLPLIEAVNRHKADKENSSAGTARALAVVVSPTRELAHQTHATIQPLAEQVGLSSVCLFGGASKDDQRKLLLGGRKKGGGADIIVATPGRLKDFISDGTVSLGSARFVVLDEADRMLDKGFEDDIKLILGECPDKSKRQTLMFTATWPVSVRVLAESFMVDPVKVTIGGRGQDAEAEGGSGNGTIELQANSRIAQTVEVVDPRNKEWRLLELLKEAQRGKAKDDRILVFCLYKKEATRVENFLQKKGIRVASIHGDLKQEQRTRSLEAFKAGTTSVLVATDVAARGLDIPEVKLVINVTFPLTIEDYVHRIGRTGRAGKSGKAITLFTEHDKAHSGSLVNILKGAGQPVPDDLLKFGTTVKKKAHDTYGAFFKDVDMSKKGTKITFD